MSQFTTFMIDFIIKSFFFSQAESYNFEQKLYTAYFFLPFYEKIIKIVCTIFAITIKDLEIDFNNSNFLISKNAIWFELSAPKEKTGK